MRISTIIPAYNRADLIGETLRSILAQTRPPDEVIVVDDGSTDGTPEVAASYGKAVTLLRQANAGPGPARNAGFAASTGEIVHFMDSDDLCTLNFYAVAAAAIEAGADMTYGPWLKTRIAGNVLHPEPMVLQQGPVPPAVPMDVLSLMVDWITVLQPCLIRRSLLEAAGKFRADVRVGEDMELLYRMLTHAAVARHTPETLLLYRVHPENQLSERDLGNRLVDRARVWGVLQEHLDGRNDLAGRTRRRFRRKKFDVAVDAMAHDPDRASRLAADVTALDRVMRPLRHLHHRIVMRWQVMRTGNPYGWTVAAAPLRPGQRDEIARLGYRLQA